MGRNIYLGVGDKIRKMTKAYLGVDGTARKIKKIYVGVDDKARLAYTDRVSVAGINLTWNIGDAYGDVGYGPNGTLIKRLRVYPTTFTAAITPEDATDKTLTWSLSGNCTGTKSNNTSYSVSPSKSGQAILTVQSADGPTVRARITVAVQTVTRYATFNNIPMKVTGDVAMITSVELI